MGAREDGGGSCEVVGIELKSPDVMVEMLDPDEGIGGIEIDSQDGVGVISLGVGERSLGIVGGLDGI